MPGLGTPTGLDEMRSAAVAARSMAKTIRQYLPIQGEPPPIWNHFDIDDAFRLAGEDYTSFERIRNPNKLAWPGTKGSFHLCGPSKRMFVSFKALCDMMERVCETYGWQGLSDETRIPHSIHEQDPIPAIDPRVLNAVESSADELLAELALVDKTPPGKPPDNEPLYLDLDVDDMRREVSRKGKHKPVKIAGPVVWPMFNMLYKAKGSALSRAQLRKLDENSPSAKRTAKGRLNTKLRTLAVVVTEDWRLVDVSQA